jgi:hypothetical protein
MLSKELSGNEAADATTLSCIATMATNAVSSRLPHVYQSYRYMGLQNPFGFGNRNADLAPII